MSFGQTVPPLWHFIKDILNRYPDGSQILKELLQNAEDAGAENVKFLYDENSYGSSTLFKENLKPFQGPAIYAYNDALFEEADWQSIQQPSRSQKSDDCLKVGRFGIGFNSVYHLTDLPWILSGDCLGIFDPSEELFVFDGRRQSGWRWHLSKEKDRKEILSLRDQFQPIHDVIRALNGTGLFNMEYYNGTLFRFPLRRTQSELSSTIYSAKQVWELVTGFKEEIPLLPMFLNHIQSIEFLHRDAQGNITTIQKVQISSKDIEAVLRQRHIIVENAKTVSDLNSRANVQTVSRNFTFSIEIQDDTGPIFVENIIVSHFIPSRDQAPKAWELASKMKCIPWVSSAAVINASKMVPEGRPFCFMPLPATEENSTGFPVHFNAYFGLADNRRSLKWLSSDQQKEKAALWNQALVTEALPHVYTQLLNFGVCNYGAQMYSMWPNLEIMKPQWKPLLKPFFTTLFKLPILQLSNSDLTWIRPASEVFLIDNLDETCKDKKIVQSIRGWLSFAKSPFVTLPIHVMNCIKQYENCLGNTRIQYTTSDIIVEAVRRINERQWKAVTEEMRLNLLHYILSLPVERKCKANLLLCLPIIPLVGGSYSSITDEANKNIIYITDDEVKFLLPAHQYQMVEKEKLNYGDWKSLLEIANWNDGTSFNLKVITTNNFHIYLPESLPKEWKQGKNILWDFNKAPRPSQIWVKRLWNYLQKFSTLERFQSLSIIPISIAPGKNLMAAVPLLPYIRNSTLFLTGYYSPGIEAFLEKVNATKVPRDVLTIHPNMRNVIRRESINDFFCILSLSDLSNVIKIIKTSANLIKELKTYISDNISLLQAQYYQIFKMLPIFQVRIPPMNNFNLSKLQNVSYSDCQSNDVSFIKVEASGLPSQLVSKGCVLNCSDNESAILATRLKIPEVSIDQLARDIVKNKNLYNTKIFSELMLWVLNKVPLHVLTDLTRNVPFIPSDDNSYHTVNQMFEQNQNTEMLLHSEKGFFPKGNYSDRNVLNTLRAIGLRTSTSEMSPAEILQVVNTVHQNGATPGKQQLLLRLICDNWRKMGPELNVIRNRNLRIFSCVSTPPEDYPITMTWFGSKRNTYFPAKDIVTASALFLVGSQVPVIDHSLPVEVQKAVGIQFEENINVLFVLKHLKEIIHCFAKSPTVELSKFEAMLSRIYHWLFNAASFTQSSINNVGLCDWFWIGDGFCSPKKIVLQWKNFPNGIKPYYYNLPTFLQDSKFKCEILPRFGAAVVENGAILKDALQAIAKNHRNTIQSSKKVRCDLDTTVKILRVLAEDPDADLSGICVPLQNTSQESQLKFHLATECQYSDDSSSLIENVDNVEDIKLVHSFVDKALAEKIGVSSLSAAVLNLEEFAQEESLITRIKDILKDNPLGATVFYELMQNADDAKATQIKFLLDMRANKNHRKKLLAESFRDFQGPALWVHNNSTFTKDDYKNIISLGGATKRPAADKIGNFGLGFNCVYHITDLPSFVSGQYLTIFDPHCYGIKCGGVKMDLSRNAWKLTALSDQFAPYHNVYECDMSYKEEGVNYPFTLFRLPLRGPELCSRSKLSNEVCNLDKMGTLLETFETSSAESLLFVQHIKNVDFEYHPVIGASQSRIIQVVKTYNENYFDFKHKESILHEFKKALNDPTPSISYSIRCEIRSTVKRPVDGFCNLPNLEKSSRWLIQWSFEDGAALYIARTERGKQNGLIPGVAVALKMTNDLQKFDKCDGEAFCYLPLRIKTNLPVHVHAPFALSSNRRHVYKDNSGDVSSIENLWNKALLSDALVTCYIKLLVTLRNLQQRRKIQDDKYDVLWPDGNVTELFHPMVEAFYERICSEDTPPLWKSYDGNWVTFEIASFLQLDDNWTEEMQSAARTIFKEVTNFNASESELVPLPSYVTGIENSSHAKTFEDNCYDEKRFFTEIFFPNIKSIPSEQRDIILVSTILKRHQESKQANIPEDFFLKLCKTYDCIPSSPDGNVLKKPEDLVAHGKQISQLFHEHEGRFAFGKYRNKAVESILISLGMEKLPLPGTLIERARSIEILVDIDPALARKRSDGIVLFLAGMKYKSNNLLNIRSVKFLFPKMKPKDWHLPWFEENEIKLYSSSELYRSTEENILCISAVVPLWDEPTWERTRDFEKSLEILGFVQDKPPQLLFKQIQTMKDSVGDITDLIYNRLQDCIATTLNNLQNCLEINPNLVGKLKKLEILVFSKKYVPYDCVCIEKIESTLQTYFHTLNGSKYMDAQNLLQLCGVKDKFRCEDFKTALVKMKEEFGKTPLQHHDIQTYFSLTKELINSAKQEDIDEATVSSWNLPVPDSQNRFYAPKELAFRERESTHVTRNKNIKLCNEGVTIQLMKWLGIPLFRTQLLDSSRRAFGQKEDLTTKIRNILSQYSNQDADIINEMIQNADDAGATEIHFILDTRSLPTKNIICENAKLLQGPSLLVYNNKPFSEDDFEGISKLGIGSKQHDTSRTGKFGIGFNTVYHVTDVPMFLTENSKLCILDPHIAYINDTATEEAPGALFDVSNEDFRTLSSDTLTGFISTEEINLEIGTMFRLPLRGTKMASASKIKPKQTTVEDVKNFLNLIIEEKGKSLLFLNNVRKLVISHLLENGQLKHQAKFEFILNAEDEKERVNFANNLSNVSICLTINLKYQGLLRSEMFKKVGKSTIQETCWRVRQRLVNVAQEDPKLSKRMEEENYFSISATGGYAFPVEYDETMKFSWFTTLPIPRAVSSIPMHINGQLLLDSGRRDLQLTDYSSHKYQWNEFVLSKVLGPLYIDILKEMKDEVIRNWTEESASEIEEKYLSFFPKSQKYVQSSATPETIILNHVYIEMYENNMDLLFGHHQISTEDMFEKQLFWLSPRYSIFNCLNIKDTTLQTYAKDLLNVLEKVQYNVVQVHFANTVKPSLEDMLDTKKCSIDLHAIQSDTVWKFLTKLKDEKLLKHHSRTTTLPAALTDTVITIEEITSVLQFCNGIKEWHNIPVLLTSDMILRRFTRGQDIFKNELLYLLPSQPNLFLTDQISWPDLPKTYCKEMTLWELSNHLSGELPQLHSSNAINVRSIPNLVDEIWEFIDSKKLKKELGSLHNWALIPVIRKLQKGNVLYLLPVEKSNEVMGFENEIFEKLGCWFLNHNSWTLRNICIKNSLEMDKIVNVVYSMTPDVEKLPNAFKKKLIKLVFHNLKSPEFCKVVHKLRSIPFFITYNGNYINLESNKTHIACIDIIENSGLDIMCDKRNVIIMNYEYIQKEVEVGESTTTAAELLGVKAYDAEKFYATFVLDTLLYFNIEAMIWQLVFIKSRKKNFSDDFFSKMKSTPFIEVATGERRSSMQLFEPGIRFLEGMYSEDRFLPYDFLQQLERMSEEPKAKWITFFRKHLGLKSVIGKEEFLVLVRQISENGKQVEMTEEGFSTLQRNSELAVKYLWENQHLREDESLLIELRSIKFVVIEKPEKCLEDLHPGFPVSSLTLSFQDVVPSSSSRLIWTVKSLCSDRIVQDIPLELLSAVGLQNITVDEVIDNLQKVCLKLKAEKQQKIGNRAINKRSLIKELKCVIDKSLEFVQQNFVNITETQISTLKNIPMILVEDGTRLACVSQVMDAQCEECPPYLYLFPKTGFFNQNRFLSFFYSIGLKCEVISCVHYANVLEECYKEHGSLPIVHPNTLLVVQRAYKNFLSYLLRSNQQEMNQYNGLYLLDEQNCLRTSTSFVVLKQSQDSQDSPHYVWNTACLWDLRMDIQDIMDKLKLLPGNLRPKFETDYALYSIAPDSKACVSKQSSMCALSVRLEKLLQSQDIEIVYLLITRLCDLSHVSRQEFRNQLRSVNVVCLQTVIVNTTDKENGHLIRADEKAGFVVKDNEELNIYISHQQWEVKKLDSLKVLAELIKEVVPFSSSRNRDLLAIYLRDLDFANPNSLQYIPDSLGISEFVSVTKQANNNAPGRFVSGELCRLLDQHKDNCFYVSEIAAIKIANRRNGFIFCAINRIMSDVSSDSDTKEYLVDCGNGSPRRMTSMDLYKFLY